MSQPHKKNQGSVLIVSNPMTTLIGEGILTSQMKTLFKFCQPDVPLTTKQLRAVVFQAA